MGAVGAQAAALLHAARRGNALPPVPEPAAPKRAAHYLWAVLIACIYEVFPLLCPLCGGQMRIIAFITHSADIRHLLDHIGPDWDLAAQPAPDFDVDQRVNW